MASDRSENRSSLLIATGEFFKEAVEDALTQRKVKATPLAEHYLVQLLDQFVAADRLFSDETESGEKKTDTLAEMFLQALNSAYSVRVDLLKKLGDNSLYISGFFGDSLNRKIVDVDYYVQMGGNAYGTLATQVKEESFKQVYGELAERFSQFVDVLTYISTKTFVQTNEDLLRLYDRYVRTGSELARDQLLEKGLITPAGDSSKKYEQ